MGDKSDNIPGVQGIGEKTALSIIKEYKTIENLYKELGERKSRNHKRKNKRKTNKWERRCTNFKSTSAQ